VQKGLESVTHGLIEMGLDYAGENLDVEPVRGGVRDPDDCGVGVRLRS